MDNNFTPEYKKDLLRLSLYLGELMLSNGAETYRVEDSILRICKSRGFLHINVFVSPTVIIISDEKFDGLSFMKTIKSRSINLNKISALNTFSRDFVSNKDISLKDAMKKLKVINDIKSYPTYVVYICTGLAAASFACLLGAKGFMEFFFTFVVCILGILTSNKIMELSNISVFSSSVAAFVIGFFGVILTEIGILDTPKMLIVGSIMPLLPGVSFVKGLRDLISGDLISGVARAFDATVTAIGVASGVGLMLDMWLRFGGGVL